MILSDFETEYPLIIFNLCIFKENYRSLKASSNFRFTPKELIYALCIFEKADIKLKLQSTDLKMWLH